MTQKDHERSPLSQDLVPGEKGPDTRTNPPTHDGAYEHANWSNPMADMKMIFQTPDFEPLLHELSTVDFVLMDLTLYLDTHPEDAEAIAQYNHLTMRRNHLKDAYEARFGPLSARGGSYSSYPWSYGKTPWPWQV